MPVDVLYVSFNRLRYTAASFGALMANTDWRQVATLFIADDGSTDGTAEWLRGRHRQEAVDAGFAHRRPNLPRRVKFLPSPFGGPVAAANLYLDHATPGVEVFGKVDNDTVVPPGWLGELLAVMEAHPEVDLLGMAPRHGPPLPAQAEPGAGRGVELAPFVDGNGLWRHRTFEKAGGRPDPDGPGGRFGFTEFQEQHPEVVKAWVTPDLPVFQLDQLPFEPWLSQAAEYVEAGWQRPWGPFSPDATGYWQWWVDGPGAGA